MPDYVLNRTQSAAGNADKFSRRTMQQKNMVFCGEESNSFLTQVKNFKHDHRFCDMTQEARSAAEDTHLMTFNIDLDCYVGRVQRDKRGVQGGHGDSDGGELMAFAGRGRLPIIGEA